MKHKPTNHYAQFVPISSFIALDLFSYGYTKQSSKFIITFLNAPRTFMHKIILHCLQIRSLPHNTPLNTGAILLHPAVMM